MADHLSRLTIAHNTHSPPINDEFLEASLLVVESAPWYAHIANFLATREILVEWKAQDKKFFFRPIPTIGRNPSCSNIMLNKLLEYVCMRKSNKEYSITAMRVHVEVILLHRKLP